MDKDFKGYKGKTIKKIKQGIYYLNRDEKEKDKNLKYIKGYLEAIKGPLGLTELQTQRAWYLYNKIKELKINLGYMIEVQMDACVKIVSKKTREEIAAITNNDYKHIYKAANKITLNNKLNQLVKKY